MHRENSKLREFINKRRPSFFQEIWIQENYQRSHLFGMIECDIEVPEKWEGTFWSPMPPREYFGEMSPLCCTATVPFDSISEHMQEYHVE